MNHSVLPRDVSSRSLEEILGDLEGRTLGSSSMISSLRVDCVFGRTFLRLGINCH